MPGSAATSASSSRSSAAATPARSSIGSSGTPAVRSPASGACSRWTASAIAPCAHGDRADALDRAARFENAPQVRGRRLAPALHELATLSELAARDVALLPVGARRAGTRCRRGGARSRRPARRRPRRRGRAREATGRPPWQPSGRWASSVAGNAHLAHDGREQGPIHRGAAKRDDDVVRARPARRAGARSRLRPLRPRRARRRWRGTRARRRAD